MKQFISLEICAQSLTSALIAQAAGASRVELCSAIEVGGLTPSPATIIAARQQLHIPICVLIRPRAGDFCYSDLEYELIKQDILFCKMQQIEAVVVGILDKQRQLHLSRMAELLELARPMQVVCHRAFDRTPDPVAALQTLIALGYDRVLTSGQQPTVDLGKQCLRMLIEKAAGRIEIMPGSGVTAQNIIEILQFTQAKSIHLTAKQKIRPDEHLQRDWDENHSETHPLLLRQIIQKLIFHQFEPINHRFR